MKQTLQDTVEKLNSKQWWEADLDWLKALSHRTKALNCNWAQRLTSSNIYTMCNGVQNIWLIEKCFLSKWGSLTLQPRYVWEQMYHLLTIQKCLWFVFPAQSLADNKSSKSRKRPPVIFITNLCRMAACPWPITNAFSKTVRSETCREVVGSTVGLVSKANDDKVGLKREGEQIKEIAGKWV